MPRVTVDLMDSPGIVRDVPVHKLTPSAFSDGGNFKFTEEGAVIFDGDREVFAPSIITPDPVWIQPFPSLNAPKWVYANLSQVWAVDDTTHGNITRASGNYNGIAEERWNATLLSGIGILNNTIDPPQMWTDFDLGTDLADLTNWPANTSCKSLRAFKNFLVALDITESSVRRPYRVRWSHPAAPGAVPASWDTGDPTFDAREFDLAQTPDYLVDQLPLADMNIIYKEESTWGMSFIGAPQFFRFWKILDGQGILHRDCAVAIPKGHVVATQDDLIVHSGQVQSSESLVHRRLRRWIFSTIDQTNYRNSYMFADHSRNEAWFCFPEVGATYATIAVVWNWAENSIGLRDLDEVPFVAVGPIGSSLNSDLVWDLS